VPDTFTEHLNLTKPEDGLSTDTWGIKLNADLDALDDEFDPETGHNHAGLGAPIPPAGLAGVGATGVVIATSETAFTTRALTAADGVAILDGTGVGGNPTIGANISNLTVKAEAASADQIMLLDSVSGQLRRMTRNAFLAGVVGSVGGPDSATANALARFLGTTGQIIQNSPVTLSDAGVMAGAILGQHRIQSQSLGSVSGATALNWSLGSFIALTVGGAVAFSVSNPPASGHLGTLMLEITGGGNHDITWPASFRWPGGSAPALSTGTDIVFALTRDGGTTWRATRTMRNSS